MRPAARTVKKETKKIKLKKALTVANIQNQKIEYVALTGSWFEALGKPQNRGLWFVYGDSGSGKSSYLMQMAKEFAGTMKVLYNLLEEETDDSDYIKRTELFSMHEVADKFHTVSYTLDELDAYLEKPNRPGAVFIDSLVYATKDWERWYAFKKKWAHKVILVVSAHAKGKNPKTDFEDRVRFDAKMKIFVSGYLAVCQGRTIGANGGTFIVYQEGYEKLRGAS